MSPWAPKSKRNPAANLVDDSDEKGKQKSLLINVDLEGEEGSDTLAQILGFKFGFYQVSVSPTIRQSHARPFLRPAPDSAFAFVDERCWRGSAEPVFDGCDSDLARIRQTVRSLEPRTLSNQLENIM